jgi:hypothetical protein
VLKMSNPSLRANKNRENPRNYAFGWCGKKAIDNKIISAVAG